MKRIKGLSLNELPLVTERRESSQGLSFNDVLIREKSYVDHYLVNEANASSMNNYATLRIVNKKLSRAESFYTIIRCSSNK